jgi:hypothetical protein
VFDPIRYPTQPYDPVIIPRGRPISVAVAGVALYGAGGIGMVAALALLGATGAVVDDFRSRAVGIGVSPADAADIAGAIRTALLSTGCGALALAAVSLLLARGVLRRNEASRIGALVVAGASLGCALVRTSVTAFGGSVDWSVAAGHTDPSLAGAVAQAFGEAMPGWFVGLGGGLTDLQSLSYIAVAVLLVAPSSREYFRTRAVWYAGQLE